MSMPLLMFQIPERGFIREGYFADSVIVDLNSSSSSVKRVIFYTNAAGVRWKDLIFLRPLLILS